MEKKRAVSVLWLLTGLAIGVLLTLLCWMGLEKAEENQRFRYCLNYDYSFLNPADAQAVEEDGQGMTCYFEDITFRREGEETLLFDNWSGQMRQYHKGVLFLLFVAEYGHPRPDYRQYQIRSLEDCEELSRLFGEGKYSGAGRWNPGKLSWIENSAPLKTPYNKFSIAGAALSQTGFDSRLILV